MEIRDVQIRSSLDVIVSTPIKSGVEILSVQGSAPAVMDDLSEQPQHHHHHHYEIENKIENETSPTTLVTQELSAVNMDTEPPPVNPKQAELKLSSTVIEEHHQLVFLRVSYIGLSEHSDEWIDISSDCNRVRSWNSMSGGKRGEALLREEVVFLAINHAIATDTEDAIFGIRAHNPLFSPFYIDIAREFGAMAGIERINALFSGSQLPLYLDTALHLMVAFGELCVVCRRAFHFMLSLDSF